MEIYKAFKTFDHLRLFFIIGKYKCYYICEYEYFESDTYTTASNFEDNITYQIISGELLNIINSVKTYNEYMYNKIDIFNEMMKIFKRRKKILKLNNEFV